MPSSVFEPAIPEFDRTQTYVLDRTTTGITTDLILQNSMGCKNDAKLGVQRRRRVQQSGATPNTNIRGRSKSFIYQQIHFISVFSLSNGSTARGGPRPPSRVSSILPGLGRLFSNFYTLALLHLPPLHLPSAAWVSLWGAFLLAH